MTRATTAAPDIDVLRRSLRGELILPGDFAYDDRRRLFNAMHDKRPAVIARCRGLADIADAVKLARSLALEVAVKGGGHNVAGRATVGRSMSS